MGDMEKAVAECHDAHGKREISDAAARVIASMYHEGQASVSYSFVSTGAIPDDTSRLWREMFPDYSACSTDERLLADMMGTYLISNAGRGRVDGWANLWL